MASRLSGCATRAPRALDALEQLAEYTPAAARDAIEAMERMASTGFNYRRLTRKGILCTSPPPKLGLFYLDDGRTLIVVDVVDARPASRVAMAVPSPRPGHRAAPGPPSSASRPPQ
jgi:hypothetical protein